MKNHLIISILILFVGVGQSNKEYNIDDRVEKNRLPQNLSHPSAAAS